MDRFGIMPFGKKFRAGNFEVLKFTRALGSEDLRRLRDGSGVSRDDYRLLKRSGVPFIKVSALSGIWSVEFAFNTQMFGFLDHSFGCGESTEGIDVIFNTMFADTTLFGDEEYFMAKREVIAAYLSRIDHDELSDEEDGKILDGLRQDEEFRGALIDFADEIGEEVSDE